MLLKKLYFDSIKLAGMQDHRRKKHYLLLFGLLSTQQGKLWQYTEEENKKFDNHHTLFQFEKSSYFSQFCPPNKKLLHKRVTLH